MKNAPLAIALLLVSLVVQAGNAPAADEGQKTAPPDPIVGNWRWGTFKFTVDIRADGTFQSTDQNLGSGVWKALPSNSSEGKYQLTWLKGAIVDTLTLSRDGKKLSGKNSNREKFTSQRVE